LELNIKEGKSTEERLQFPKKFLSFEEKNVGEICKKHVGPMQKTFPCPRALDGLFFNQVYKTM